MLSAVRIAQSFMKECIEIGDTVVDGTAGNGNDTLFLSSCVGENGKVIAIDIQEEAITSTKRMLEQHQRLNVQCIVADHSHIERELQEHRGRISCITFNLGYLPGATDHSIITTAQSTITALNACLELLNGKGCISVVAYRGHDHGQVEATAVEGWMKTLPANEWHVVSIMAINQSSLSPVVYFARRKETHSSMT